MSATEVQHTSISREYFHNGHEAEQAGNYEAAISSYRAAYTANPDAPDICFRLAYLLDLVGEEDEAVALYEQCVKGEKPHLNALTNLAILYEDRSQYAQAERCLRQILATNFTHKRANLYLKDVLESKGMLIDDEQERKLEKHNALLDTPVTDFELSVRTRNALRKMNIRTLGDLLKVTESELRSFKNFGDASLDEIKAMLAQKTLKLGQAVEMRQEEVKAQVYEQIEAQGGDTGSLNRPVGDLDLSVRSRKALALLGIHMISDLVLKTEAELMGVKNFGMTSLTEIDLKLKEMGLSLRVLENE